MKQWIGWIVLTAVMIGAAGAQGTGGAGGGGEKPCPNEMATDVASTTKQQGGSKKCGIGIVAFGFGGGFFGEECPAVKLTTPGHQKCGGEPLEEHKCVIEGKLKVKREECDCGGLVVPWIEVGIPVKCDCKEKGDGGTIEDFQTLEC